MQPSLSSTEESEESVYRSGEIVAVQAQDLGDVEKSDVEKSDGLSNVAPTGPGSGRKTKQNLHAVKIDKKICTSPKRSARC